MTPKTESPLVPFVIVTGLSGAGKSLFLKSLEDLGYETIDNLPLSLLQPAIVEKRPAEYPLAIGIDVRSRHFAVPDLLHITQQLRNKGTHLTLTFLESDDLVLQNRYRETRRHHPLVHDSTLAEGILRERKLLKKLKEKADYILDTSLLTPPECRALVRERFAFSNQRTLAIHLLSFAFRKGVPREADMVFDMRFLKNPYYDPQLKSLTGQTHSVKDYLREEPAFQSFGESLKQMLTLMLPPIETEGRDFFTIAFGCTGGQHRSVFTAEWTEQWLSNAGYTTQIHHRELNH